MVLKSTNFRKSQQKFGEGGGDLQDEYLEVVKYAMPSPVCLNRPFITILDQVSAKQSTASHRRITKRVHYYLERELCSLSSELFPHRLNFQWKLLFQICS